MPDPYTLERIENWAGDFCQQDRMIAFGPETAAAAPQVLVMLLAEAADQAGALDDLDEPSIKYALITRVGMLDLSDEVRREIPGLCSAFLGWLEGEGRLAGGRALGAFAIALKQAFMDAQRAKPRQYVRPAKPVGPNDPCPCGSGLKYKKCCMRR